jgi:hypothetical protein
MFERNFLHRSSPQAVSKTGVVNDAAVADVDAVMTVERTWGNEMRGDRWLLTSAKK